MQIGSARGEPGRLTTGHVELGQYPDGPIMAPVMIAKGRRPGPRLWVQCLVHGPEVGAPIALARFLRALDLDAFGGTIAALMAANPLGLRAYNRLTPNDGMNLNRVFPGKPDGSVSEQLAHRVHALAVEHGDVMLDLHSGGDLTITAFYVIYPKEDAAWSREAARLCAATGSRYQWGSTEGWLRGAAFGSFARRTQRPALIMETGGGGRVTEQDLANYKLALTGLCQALGMLAGTPVPASDVRHGGNAIHVKATRGGFWHPAVAPGDDMVAGRTMGRVVDVFGAVVEEVPCPIAIRRPYMGVFSGDQLVEVVESLPA
ncbi:MAG: hypothetical protein FJX57_10715 [Alphaproteobacteria bacterium]|nr:hypothetical protein [Alphaproteobacteria bacterium]